MWSDQRSDGELIRASVTESRLFEMVFTRHYDAIFRYVVRRVGRDDGQDLVSEVFALAFADRHKFWPGAESARPWLFGIAANLCRRHARSYARKTRAYLRAATPTAETDPSEAVAARVDAQRSEQLLSDAIGKLKRIDREVLLLSELGDLSNREISQVLKLPAGTVGSKLFRARAKLSAELSGIVWNIEDPIGKGEV